MEKNIAYDAELKVNNWVKVIKVNEQGDTISLNIGDNSLIKNLVTLINDIQNIGKELNEAEKKFGEDYEEEEFMRKLDFLNLKMAETSEKIDSFFGFDTCMKVFRTNTPYIDDVMDFLFQISDLIEKFTGEKVANLENIKKKFTDRQKNRRKI
ncbi:MAG: hypothetical protein K2N51_17125 [Lachnospiraceae bacterium]|nr:hypothetical protein [Lachnospiraceae bacterium]